MTERRRLIALASVFAVLVLWAAGRVADAQDALEPWSFRWVMPWGDAPAESIVLRLGELDPIGISSDCAPGSICTVETMIPTGCHVVTLSYLVGGVESPPSVAQARCTERARYDRDGDSLVTNSDFGPFLHAWRTL